MSRLGRGAKAQDGAGKVDGAKLFRPEVIFGHIGEAAESTDALGDVDLPTRFLEHFAVKGGDGVFALVDSATGKLEFGFGFGLVRQKHIGSVQQNGINAGSARVALTFPHSLTISTDHVHALGPKVAVVILARYASQGQDGRNQETR